MANKNLDLRKLNAGNVSRVNRSESLTKFLNRIRSTEALTKEQEDEVFDLIKNGTEDEAQKAKNALATSNQKFVYAVAKRYSNDDSIVQDLVQVGMIGLLYAIDSFDPTAGNRFLTYAVHYIRREIVNFYSTDFNSIQKTNSSRTQYILPKVRNDFYAREGRYPTEIEIIDILDKEYGLKISEVEDLYDVRVDSINSVFDDSDDNCFENSDEFNSATASLNDYVKTEDNDYNHSVLMSLLNTLPEREKNILLMSFGIGYDYELTNDTIGEKLGMTSERVRQLKESAIKKLNTLATHTI